MVFPEVPFDHDEDRFGDYLTEQGTTREEFDADARREAERNVKTRLVLDALADQEEVSVSDQELTERIVFQAQQYQMPPEEFVRRIQEAGQLGAIYADVRRSKALLATPSTCPTCSARPRATRTLPRSRPPRPPPTRRAR